MATGHTAKNDITGQYIKSRPSTKAWSDNYEKAFSKKTILEWAQFDEESLEHVCMQTATVEKISYKEFVEWYNQNKEKDAS